MEHFEDMLLRKPLKDIVWIGNCSINNGNHSFRKLFQVKSDF